MVNPPPPGGGGIQPDPYMPAPYLTMTFQDVSGEKSTVSVYLPDIAPDGSDYEDIVGGDPSVVTQIVNGIGALTACTLISYSVTVPIFLEEDPALPAHWVHRENKMLITYTDDVNGKKGSLEIPGPDTNAFPLVAGDSFNLTAILAALTTLLENNAPANMVSRDSNAVTWRNARLVGRNI